MWLTATVQDGAGLSHLPYWRGSSVCLGWGVGVSQHRETAFMPTPAASRALASEPLRAPREGKGPCLWVNGSS